MRRLTRAIEEIKSFSAELDGALYDPQATVTKWWLNSALFALAQVEKLAPTHMQKSRINPHVDRVAEIIRQVNSELNE